MRHDETLRPVLGAALGVALLSCLDATMKGVSAAYPLGEVVALRYLAGVPVALLAFLGGRLLGTGEPWPGRAAVGPNLVRALVTLGTALTFFTAIARLPLVEAVALTFMAPLLMVAFGRLLLGEPISRVAVAGLVLGLVGVVVIARGQEGAGGSGLDLVGLGAALGCAVLYALSNVMLRQGSAAQGFTTIVLLSSALILVLSLPLVPLLGWRTPTPAHWITFALAGLFGTGGGLAMAWAYARAPAGRLAVLEYTAFLWASGFGYLFFAEVPTAWTVAGAVLIGLASLSATWKPGTLSRRPLPTEVNKIESVPIGPP